MMNIIQKMNMLLLSFYLLSNIQFANADICSEYNMDGSFWPEFNLCNLSSSYSYPISTTTLLALLSYHWVSIFICIICIFIACGILFYLYKRHKYSRPSKVIPADVITISSMSQSQNFNDPISFLQLSSPPPSYTNVFTNIAE